MYINIIIDDETLKELNEANNLIEAVKILGLEYSKDVGEFIFSDEDILDYIFESYRIRESYDAYQYDEKNKILNLIDYGTGFPQPPSKESVTLEDVLKWAKESDYVLPRNL